MSYNHFLYVLAETPDGPVKIGHSGNLTSRVSSLRSGNARHLICAWVHPFNTKQEVRSAEAAAHAYFAAHRMSGEWFDICPYAAAFAITRILDLGDTLDVDVSA